MSKQHRHDVPEDNQPRNLHQSSMDYPDFVSDLESKILTRLGFGGSGDEKWRKQVGEIEQIVEEAKPNAVKNISAYFESPDEDMRIAAVRALQKLAKLNPGLVPPQPFIDALYNKYLHVRAAAVESVTAYGAWRLPDEVLKELMNRLMSGHEGDDKLVRMLIVHLLASLFKRAPIQSLPAELRDEHMYSSRDEIYNSALQSLVAALGDDDWQVREATVLALSPLIQNLSHTQHQQLDSMIYDEDAFVRKTVRLILRERTLEVRLHRDLLSPASTKRSQAALVLGEIGDLAPETLEALLTVAQDIQAKSEIREAALLTFIELRTPIDKEALNQLLDDKDESVREAALLLYTILEPDQSSLYEDAPNIVKRTADNIIHINAAKRVKGKIGARNKGQPGA